MSEDVGVLLPVQLETLFDPPEPLGPGEPGATPWRVRVRVIPQPPAVDEHDPRISVGELEAVTVFWRAVGHVGPATTARLQRPGARAAFDTLARATGPARAAFLVTATRAVRREGRLHGIPLQDDTGTDLHADGNLVRGLPPRLAVGVWTYAPGGAEVLQRIGQLPDDSQPPEARIPDPLPVVPPGEPEDLATNWLTDADRARECGMLGIFDLPHGLTPDTLGGLVVWGLGEQDPAELFTAHTLNGSLAPLPLGAATNSVAGDPTATSDTGRDGSAPELGAPDAQAWWDTLVARVGATPGTAPGLDAALEQYVAGSPLPSPAGPLGLAEREAREALPGDPQPGTGLSRLLTAALWPALWGGALVEEWRVDPDVATLLTAWALDHVAPEGPLPSLRIDDQPYGLLPVTHLAGWKPDDGGPLGAGLTHLRDVLLLARDDLHGRLRPGGTTLGATPDRYAHLLTRGGVSTAYDLVGFGRVGHYQHVPGLPEMADRTMGILGDLGLPVPHHPVTGEPDVSVRLWATGTGLPLVRHPHSAYADQERRQRCVPLRWLTDLVLGREELGHLRLDDPTKAVPTRLGEVFGVRPPGSQFWLELWDEGHEDPSEFMTKLRRVPDSLASRLLLQACFTANRWRLAGELDRLVVPVTPGDPGGDDPQAQAAMRLATLLDPGRPVHVEPDGEQAVAGSPEVPLPYQPDPGVAERVERALAATIDTMSHRLDPWVTAVAWQRLREVTGGGARHRLGAYGWVCGPFVGTPGPTPAGLLHTPSLDQTLTATIARDGYRAAAAAGTLTERGTVPWDMALTSERVRLALELAADLRDGLFLEQALGSRVEQILLEEAAPGAITSWYARLAALRDTYPSHADSPDLRVVCQGELALSGLLDAPPAAFPLTGAQRERLGELRAALEALADLIELEGVHASTTRSTGRAAAVMDVAAGAGPVPELSFPSTPSTGLDVATLVLSVLPVPEAVGGDGAGRGDGAGGGEPAGGASIAEPAVAAFLESALGTVWPWQASFEDGTTASVTLAELGLTPVETLSWSPEQLRALAASALGARGAQRTPGAGAPDDGAPGPDTPAHSTGWFAATVARETNRTWDLSWKGEVVDTQSCATLNLTQADLEGRSPEQVEARVRAAYRRLTGDTRRVAVSPTVAEHDTLWVVRDGLGQLVGSVDDGTLSEAVAAHPETDPQAWASLPIAELETAARVHLAAPACWVSDPPELGRAGELCRTLGAPAVERDLADSREEPSVSAVAEELRTRYATLHQDLVAAIQAGAAAASGGDPGTCRAALRRAAAWGAVPDRTVADAAALHAALLGLDPPAGATSLVRVTRAATALLRERRRTAVPPGRVRRVAQPLDDILLEQRHEAAEPVGAHAIAQEISRLACPQGDLPVLARWPTADLLARTGLEGPDPALEGPAPALAGPDAAAGGDWLTQTATVRRALARVEAAQLAGTLDATGTAPFTAWSSSVGDPWLHKKIEANTRAAVDGLHDRGHPRLAVAFTAGEVLAQALSGGGDGEAPTVAVGLVDAFDEVVPGRERDTHAAFGFNAPAARAPHLILLAVPPHPDQHLEEDVLGEILRETRALMVARTARVPDLGMVDRVMRTVWLPDDEPVSILAQGAHA